MKCVGNCAICTLDVDKMACCMVQLLRNMIEVKKRAKPGLMFPARMQPVID